MGGSSSCPSASLPLTEPLGNSSCAETFVNLLVCSTPSQVVVFPHCIDQSPRQAGPNPQGSGDMAQRDRSLSIFQGP